MVKSGARLKYKMTTKIISTIAVLALVLGVQPLAQAHSQDYNDGYTTGQSYAKQGLSMDSGFFNSHSKN